MKKITILFALLLLSIPVLAQDKSTSPYEWDWTRDGIWTGAALGGSVGGFLLIQNKEGITEAELERIVADQDNINFLDRWAIGNNDENANMLSDIPFAASFAAPFVLLLDDKINDHTAQYIGIYIQSLATTATLYTITAGLVNRSRPYVYDESDDISIGRRTSSSGQRSFYSGHVAATASATFFAAKAYTDFHPDMKGKGWVWGTAAALPATVGYFRMQAGQHFTTDVLLGYALGAGAGILIPELHKTKKESGLSVFPTGGQDYLGENYQAMALRLEF